MQISKLEGFVIQFTDSDDRRKWLRSMDDVRKAAVFSTRKAAYRASMGLRDPSIIDLSADINVCVINSAN